jgi:hypothetical protein
MLSESWRAAWQRTGRYRAVALCSAAALLLLCLPLQRYFPMGRFQHYSIGFAVFALGQLLQSALSWNSYSKWGRASLLATGVCYGAIALIFWTNPWLDYKVAVQTEGKERFRIQLIAEYLTCNALIFICWTKCWSQELKKKQLNQTAAAQQGEKL